MDPYESEVPQMVVRKEMVPEVIEPLARAHMGPKCLFNAFVTKVVKLKDGELASTSNEAEFRCASFWFSFFLIKKSVFRRLDVSCVFDVFRQFFENMF